MPANKSQVRFLFTLLAVVWGFLVATNVLLAAWSNPTEVPPGSNPEPFVSTDSNNQTKAGALTIANNFYVIGSGLTGKVGIGTSTDDTSARLVVEPYTNASIDAGSGFIRTNYQAVDNADVVNKSYLVSTLGASLDPIKYWVLSGNNLYASSTAYNVAIGTTTAGTAKLTVIGGNVGIGMISPNTTLQILNSAAATTSGQNVLKLAGVLSASVAGSGPVIRFSDANGTSNMAAIRGYTFGNGLTGLAFETGWLTNTVKMVIDNSGNVGIGTTSPTSRLMIIGSGIASTTSALNIQNSSGVSNLFVRDDGYIGIGTTSPTVPLYVNGNVIADTPIAANHLATKSYVDTAAQSLWVNSGNYLYASSTSWRVGIGTTSPASALHIYPRSDIEGLRIISSNYAPLVIRDTTDQNDLFRVNQYGDATAVTSSATKMRSNQYCDANGANCFNPTSGWSTGVTTIFLTSTTTNGSFIFTGGFTGYDAGNKICNSEQPGSHFCRTDEIIYLIQKNGASGFSSINGQNAWIADGPPGYTGTNAADDCSGWTNGTTSYLGHFWIFNSTGGGSGALIHCGTVKKIACCK